MSEKAKSRYVNPALPFCTMVGERMKPMANEKEPLSVEEEAVLREIFSQGNRKAKRRKAWMRPARIAGAKKKKGSRKKANSHHSPADAILCA